LVQLQKYPGPLVELRHSLLTLTQAYSGVFFTSGQVMFSADMVSSL
jgi:hypothetical protein